MLHEFAVQLQLGPLFIITQGEIEEILANTKITVSEIIDVYTHQKRVS
jgi:hypothetical protein